MSGRCWPCGEERLIQALRRAPQRDLLLETAESGVRNLQASHQGCTCVVELLVFVEKQHPCLSFQHFPPRTPLRCFTRPICANLISIIRPQSSSIGYSRLSPWETRLCPQPCPPKRLTTCKIDHQNPPTQARYNSSHPIPDPQTQ